MQSIAGARGELVDRFIDVLRSVSANSHYAQVLCVCLGAHLHVDLFEGARLESTFLEVIRERLLAAQQASDLSEAVVVRGVASSITAFLKQQSDHLGEVNNARRDLRSKLEYFQSHPDEYRSWCEREAPGCSEASMREDEIREQLGRTINSSSMQDVDADSAAGTWELHSLWAQQIAKLLPEETLSSWESMAFLPLSLREQRHPPEL